MKTNARFIFSVLALGLAAAPASGQPRPIPVKVVVVTMFEVGAEIGDTPGELQYWVERDHLDRVFAMPAGYHGVRMNDSGEMAVLTGPGTAHAAATIMAIGLDPRFDFRHAYWIVAGIAGGCPDQVSLGSAAWARWVVDGDLGYEIDAREIPPNWPTGYLPFDKQSPFEEPAKPRDGQAYALNPGLVDWAFDLTRGIQLDDSESLKKIRGQFDGSAAERPPFVTMGDEISSSTFWYGKLMNTWAAEWMPYFTGGKGVFATTAMEDTGTLQSLTYLAKAGKADANRMMVLRTISNYDQPPRGMSAAEGLARERIGSYAAYLPALEADYRIGHAVVSELLNHWDRYEETVPGATAAAKEKP